MGLYEVHLSMALLGFGMGTMLANFHMRCVMLVLRAVFNCLCDGGGGGEGGCLAWSKVWECGVLLCMCFESVFYV